MTNEIQKISDYMRSDLVRARFAEVVGGHNTGAYISSVLLAVANSDDLQKCSIESIYISALRAATLRLSCDASTGQAYLVPFGGKATLIVGYKGLHDMAVRTGKYRYIHAAPIYEGESVEEERLSGFLTVTGFKQSVNVIGWIAAFQMMDGYSKQLYMTVEEIHAHAKKYSKSYSFKSSGWQTDSRAMEKKTVLRLLLRKWGYLDPADVAELETLEASEDNDVIPAYIAPAPKPEKDNAQLLAELGFREDPPAAPAPAPVEELPTCRAPEEVKAWIDERVSLLEAPASPKIVLKNEVNILASCLLNTLGNDTDRYAVVRWLTGEPSGSLKKLRPAQIKALLEWQGVTGFDDMPDEQSIAETHACLLAANRDAGQDKLI